MWVKPYTTNAILPLDVEADGIDLTSYTVAIVAAGAAAPTTGYAAIEISGSINGPRVTGLAPGLWDAYVKVGTEVQLPVRFRLTP